MTCTCTDSWGGSFFSDLISITAMFVFFISTGGFGGTWGREVVTVTGCGLPITTPAGCSERSLIWVWPKDSLKIIKDIYKSLKSVN